MTRDTLRVVTGPLLPEPIEIVAVNPLGDAVKIVGKGLKSGLLHDPVLNREQLARLSASPEKEPFDGDPHIFRLGIEALRLGLAYEYDPYFSLSIARVDPLPHQLEAVYDYFIKLARICFLSAARFLNSIVRMLTPTAFLHTVQLQDCLRRTYLGDATAADESLRVASDRREWLSAARGGEQPAT